jgi:hypothetical protein
MSEKAGITMSGVGGSLVLGERMRQASEGDMAFRVRHSCSAAALGSGKSEGEENTAGCNDEIGWYNCGIGSMFDRINVDSGLDRSKNRERCGSVDRRNDYISKSCLRPSSRVEMSA